MSKSFFKSFTPLTMSLTASFSLGKRPILTLEC